MPKTVTTYYIHELEGRVRQKARDSVLEEYDDWRDNWDEPLLDDFRQDMKAIGFDEIHLGYSHMFCQGRGASFACKYPDWEAFVTSQKARKRFAALLYQKNKGNLELSFEIGRSGSIYSHEMTMRIEYDYNWHDYVPRNENALLDLMNELENYMLETARDHCRKLISQLEDASLADHKDEVIEAWIQEKDITFDSEGNPFYPEDF